ncbi:CoA-acylating methylmalonate-semialdehyde dehydrogenase [Fluviispira multicolorata]|uniref:CoA-acylating methylmalonate-semialdehyde dehydrogenase n=1 Tax=Fluviispira multicolorata TaxID=2654512 RepID=A0A833JEN5_9BACT|nr:CoA-acylating methylmalonate-semialdehyde dehydrogenase [Fluviispira multicolorata]KAB8033304.1 CoA-acylating methylmalonate-semialdehyde dehydrogenase [Fluviispira multicolorata]
MLSRFVSQELIDCLNFVGGNWLKPSEELSQIKNPHTGKAIARTYRSNAQDIHKAVVAAKAVQKDWAQMSVRERAHILNQFRGWILENLTLLSQTISDECGKLPKEAQDGLLKGIEILEFAISLPCSEKLYKIPVSRGVSCEYKREPLGIVAGITPSNFPAMVPLWMIPNALIVGNCFIWKPSEKTSITSLLIAEGLKKSGLPDGVLTVVQGDKVTVEALCEHEDIKAVAFVGSTPVAKDVYKRATAQGKRALTLGGAKNHIILMPDADKETTADAILASFTGCAGQRCMAASVLLAVGEVDLIINSLVDKAKEFQPKVNIGAVITKESLNKLTTAIGTAQKEGAKILVDGRKVTIAKEYENGNWLNPTILDNVSPQSFAAKEELFGPILSIIRCKNLEEAIAIENKNPYGNAASVFTTRGDVAEFVSENASAGMIGINVGIPVPREPFSFGGINASKFGHGDITGEGGIEFWSNRKKITTKWIQQKSKNWMS